MPHMYNISVFCAKIKNAERLWNINAFNCEYKLILIFRKTYLA